MSNKYVVQLDGLRFFAVLMVMIAHWLQWQWVNPVFTNFPFVHGVILFFVLSGYLITGILLENRDKYIANNQPKSYLVKNFYIRRFLRIFPIYYLLLFFLLAINYKNTAEMFPWLVTYTSNIYQSIHNTYIGDFNHFWSLAVEEQFYLFWPCLILFIKPNKTYWVILSAIIISLISRVLFYFFVGKWMATSYFTINCMCALGLGALLAYIKIYKYTVFTGLTKNIWLIIGCILYVFALIIQFKFQLHWFKEIFDEFLFAILSFFIIAKASDNGFKGIFKSILESKFVVYSGKISYGLYVYHLFIPTLFYYIAPKIGISINNKYTYFIAFYFLTFLVAHISWILIESPISKLKDRVNYVKQELKKSDNN